MGLGDKIFPQNVIGDFLFQVRSPSGAPSNFYGIFEIIKHKLTKTQECESSFVKMI